MKKYRLMVSIHTLMMAGDCRTRLALRLAGMRDKGEPPAGSYVSMISGKHGHAALAEWLSGRDWKEGLLPFEEVSRALGITTDRRGYGNLYRIVEEVVNRFTPISKLPFDLLTPETTEISFTCPLGEIKDDKQVIPVFLIGYMDKLVRDKQTGLKRPLEHKFTGRLDSAFIHRFSEYDPQTTAYMFAAKTVLGEPVGDAWVNAIETTMVPSSNRKCDKHGVEYAECGPIHVKQTFIPARRTPAQLDEFQARALDIARRYVLPVAKVARKGPRVALKAPRDGMFTGACDYCDYRRWCLGSNRSPNLLATMLTQDEYNDDRLRSGLFEEAA